MYLIYHSLNILLNILLFKTLRLKMNVAEMYDVLHTDFFSDLRIQHQLAWGRHGNNTGLLVVPTAKAKAWQIGRRIDNDDTPLSRRDSQLHRTEIVRACNIIRSHALEFIQVSPSLRLTPSYPSSMLFSVVCKVKHQIEFLHWRYFRGNCKMETKQI